MDTTTDSGSWAFPQASLAMTWLLTSLAILAVACRLYFRRRLGIQKWAIHDWIMLASVALQLAYQIGFSEMCRRGSGKFSSELTALQRFEIQRLLWITAPIAHPTSLLARISIAILLIQIFGTKMWFKRYTIIFTTFVAILGLTTFILNVAQTRPYPALWNPKIPHVGFDRRIYQWSAVALTFVFATWDLTFVVIPVWLVWELNMALPRKLGLMALLAFGLITTAAAASKGTISLLFTARIQFSLDISRGSHIICLTTCLEQALVIIIGCVPTLRPLATIRLYTTVRMIGDSLTSLVSRVRRSPAPSHAPGSHRTDHWSFENLELTPRLSVAKEAVKSTSSGPVVSSSTRTSENTAPLDGQVHRTDSFTVSYQNRAS